MLSATLRVSPPAPPPPRRVSSRGMTITEVLIAATILGFVIMTSLTALAQAYGFTRHARLVTLAGQIAQSVMEDLRLRNFAELKAYAAQAQPVSFTTALSSERFSSNFTQGYTLNGAFTTFTRPAGATYDRIAVTLTITWMERDSTFTRKTITYFGEKGLSDYYYVGWAP